MTTVKKGEEAFPIQRSHVGGVDFHSGVSIAHCRRFDAVIVKQMASDTAPLAEIGLSGHISDQIKVYSACHRLHGAKELTVDTSPKRNTTRGQTEASRVVVRHFFNGPGRYDVNALPKASQHRRRHRRGIFVRVVMM